MGESEFIVKPSGMPERSPAFLQRNQVLFTRKGQNFGIAAQIVSATFQVIRLQRTSCFFQVVTGQELGAGRTQLMIIEGIKLYSGF